MKTILWLDDIKNPFVEGMDWWFTIQYLKEEYLEIDDEECEVHWAKTQSEFENYIKENGLPDLISFDNDLGIGNVPSWGDYLINSALKYIPSVDVFFYGDEEKCHQWFSKEVGNHIEFDIISRKIIDIHGKDIRKFIIDNDEESFKIYTNKAIHSMYPQLRNKMLRIINK